MDRYAGWGLAVSGLKPKLKRRSERQPLTRSQMMARISSRDTEPELFVRAAVSVLGYRYRVDVRSLPGAPDLANKSGGWAIYVHGCFWHQHPGCSLASSPRSNRAYWSRKLGGNVKRDATNLVHLESLGFRVLVLWECECRRIEPCLSKLNAFFAPLKG